MRSHQTDTLDDAIALVNGNEHGNGTAIFTKSGAAARKFQTEVSARVLLCARARVRAWQRYAAHM